MGDEQVWLLDKSHLEFEPDNESDGAGDGQNVGHHQTRARSR